jgi:hypothetical protein
LNVSHKKRKKKEKHKGSKRKKGKKIKIDRLANTFRWLEDPSTAWLVPSMA